MLIHFVLFSYRKLFKIFPFCYSCLLQTTDDDDVDDDDMKDIFMTISFIHILVKLYAISIIHVYVYPCIHLTLIHTNCVACQFALRLPFIPKQLHRRDTQYTVATIHRTLNSIWTDLAPCCYSYAQIWFNEKSVYCFQFSRKTRTFELVHHHPQILNSSTKILYIVQLLFWWALFMEVDVEMNWRID